MRTIRRLTDTRTPIARRRIQASIEIADTPADTPAEQIAYQHTVFCQTCLPYRNPGDRRVWKRRQGAVFLQVEAGAVRKPGDEEYIAVGLPYGSRPRLIMAHLNHEALLHGSPRIAVGRSLTAFLKRIQDGRQPTGTQLCHFKDQLTRFAAALVRLSVDLPETRAYQVDTKIVDVMELWLEKNDKQRILWPEVVELSPRYFDSLTRHAVPLDERAIGALANSPMALDVYAWLAQRLCRIKSNKPQLVTWVNLHAQFGAEYNLIRIFRQSFKHILKTVKAQYPAACFDLDSRGMLLAASPPPVASRSRLVMDA